MLSVQLSMPDLKARQARMEDTIGSVNVVKCVDLAVLEKNLFDVDPNDIADVKVLGT